MPKKKKSLISPVKKKVKPKDRPFLPVKDFLKNNDQFYQISHQIGSLKLLAGIYVSTTYLENNFNNIYKTRKIEYIHIYTQYDYNSVKRYE